MYFAGSECIAVVECKILLSVTYLPEGIEAWQASIVVSGEAEGAPHCARSSSALMAYH